MAAIHRPHGTAYWLRVRHVLCPHCRERDPEIWEYPLAGILASRYSPHDSGYLLAGGWRTRSEVPQQRLTMLARETTTLYSMALAGC